jgi:O-Antigen ligase
VSELTAGRVPVGRAWPDRSLLWAAVAAVCAVLAGVLFVVSPVLVLLPVAALLASPLLVSPRVRILFLVLGTVTVFGPPELNAAKILFLFGATLALVGAFSHSRTLLHTPAYSDIRPLLVASFVLLVVVALSMPVARFNDVPFQSWLRDVAPYVLLSWAPLFALDAQSAFDVRALRRLIAVVGLLGAAAFTANTYGRRDLTGSLTADYGLVTLLLGAALFSFAIAIALDADTGRLRWLALGAIVFGMMATSGTRSAAVLLVAPLAILFGTRERFTQRSLRFLVMLPIAAILVLFSAQSLLKLVNADPEVVETRLEALSRSGTSEDASLQDRLNAISSAWDLFTSSPLLGVGPGHPIPWINFAGVTQYNDFVDTAVGFLPDYGLVGIVAAAFAAVAFVSVVRRLQQRTGGRTTAQLALIGLGAVILAYTPLQVPFEDKGLSVGLILLLAITLREASDAELESYPEPDVGAERWRDPEPARARG